LKREGLEATGSGEDRPRHRSVFLRDQARVALDNVSGVRARADRGELAFGTIDTWLACSSRR